MSQKINDIYIGDSSVGDHNLNLPGKQEIQGNHKVGNKTIKKGIVGRLGGSQTWNCAEQEAVQLLARI